MSVRFAAFAAVLLVSFSAAAAPQTVVIPAGTEIHFKLEQSIQTANAKVGQRVPAALTKPIVIGGKTIANAGSGASVKITAAEASGRMGGSAKLSFRVASITLTNGSKVDVSTASYSREGRGHAKHNATYIAGAAVVGALVGQAAGGNSHSTAKGAAIGAGVGVGAAAATGKLDFTVPAGERFSLSLRSAVTVTM